MRVIVARHDVVPVEISHPHLFVPKPKPAEVPLALEQPAENPARPIKTAANATLRATDAVQIWGADGCHEDAPVSRYYRDAKILEIIEGTTQIHEELLGRTFVDAASKPVA